HCAQCYGSDLQGGNATSLIDGAWQFGSGDSYINRNIKFGIPHLGMPSYQQSMSDDEIWSLVKYIRESEKQEVTTKPPAPEVVETMDYFINAETFADGLQIPWAIDFIDENTALITE